MNMPDRVYLRDWESWADVIMSFAPDWGQTWDAEPPAEEPKFVFASYEHGSYDGSATVIWSDDGSVFFEVYGSHCSCYGLENQWDSEPTQMTTDSLLRQWRDGTMYGRSAEDAPKIVTWLYSVSKGIEK